MKCNRNVDERSTYKAGNLEILCAIIYIVRILHKILAGDQDSNPLNAETTFYAMHFRMKRKIHQTSFYAAFYNRF